MKKPPRKRPYLDKYWHELQAIAQANWSDPGILEMVWDELGHRKRPKARELRKEISLRLSELSKESFLWPTTAILPAQKALAGNHFYYKDGLLSFLGYHVGQKGLESDSRREILNYCYGGQLPEVDSDDYMSEWGRQQTGDRLEKLANCVATFARNAKGKTRADMSAAIADWEEDLDYLKRKFYEGRYDFRWPRLRI